MPDHEYVAALLGEVAEMNAEDRAAFLAELGVKPEAASKPQPSTAETPAVAPAAPAPAADLANLTEHEFWSRVEHAEAEANRVPERQVDENALAELAGDLPNLSEAEFWARAEAAGAVVE